MIRNVISKYLSNIHEVLNEHGVVFESKYSTDVSLISEYTKSYKFRNIFGDNKILQPEDMNKVTSAPNFALLLYNRKPFGKWADVGNNVQIEAEGISSDQNGVLTLENPETDVTNLQLRTAMYGQVQLTCKIMTSNTSTLEMLEYLISHHFLRKNPKISVTLELGDGIDQIEVDYNTVHDEIDEFGFIDNRSYGDLQQLSFSVTIHGIFFSMFKTNENVKSTASLEYLFQ